MDMMQSSDQDEIQKTVATFLAERLPVVGLGHYVKPTGVEIDPAIWSGCADLGWLSLGLSEADGGVGYGLAEEAVLFRELGRGLAPGGFLPSVLAAHAAVAAGHRELAAKIASGSTRIALGTPVGDSSLGEMVSARLSLVHIDSAEYIVIVTDQATSLVKTSDVAVTAIDPADLSITAGETTASSTPAVFTVGNDGLRLYERGLVLTAAMLSGMAQAILTTAADYAKVREQFGKPIGSFQAIKHYLAHMAIQCELADSQVFYAALAVQSNMNGCADEARIAKYSASEAAKFAGEKGIQIHGGYGYTTEFTPYRHTVRAHTVSRMLSLRSQLLDAIAGR